jgi:hypothetical protein
MKYFPKQFKDLGDTKKSEIWDGERWF